MPATTRAPQAVSAAFVDRPWRGPHIGMVCDSGNDTRAEAGRAPRHAGPARLALRAATDAVHRRLHDVPVFKALAEGRLGREAYAALLRRSLGFHAALETRLDQAPSLAPYGIDAAERRRTPQLRADLAWLGASASVALAPIAPFPDAATALGGLYVAEGSALGGRLLARGLDAILPAGTDGRLFLLAHGARHAAMWRDCCAAIERCGATEAGRSAMLRGALATFAAYEAWFGDPGEEGAAEAPRGQAVAPLVSAPPPP